MNMIVGVCGFGWSGSGAVFDLLREYEDVDILDKNGRDFECTIIGEAICDLDFGLNVNNTRLSSSSYIANFIETIDYLSDKRGFDKVFKGQFRSKSKEYIDSLVEYTFEGWTYDDVRKPLKENRNKEIYNSIVKRIFGNRITKHIPFFTDIKKSLILYVTHPIRVSYYPKDFNEKTRLYLESLFDLCHPHKDYPLVVDQLFAPDCPDKDFKYFGNPKCIVVRRDPRDTYLLAKCAITNIAVPLPVNNVDIFITFYREVIEQTKKEDDANVLSINFEDLIYNYDTTVARIEKFMGIRKHVSIKEKLNPEISINNTQLFRRYPEFSDDIDKISKALPDSLYPFENYDYKRTTSKVF